MLKLEKTLGYILIRKNSRARLAGDIELCIDYNAWRVELWKVQECPFCTNLLMEYCTEVPIVRHVFSLRHGYYTVCGKVLRDVR